MYKNKSTFSNIKDIYVELIDYTYFHNPSKNGQLDNRFIGRRKLIAKLKNILTSSETRSGAYLITGFRGMGKSSLVSKVLNDLCPQIITSSIWDRIIRILSFICIFSLYHILSLEKNPDSDIPYPTFLPYFLWISGLVFIPLLVYRIKDIPKNISVGDKFIVGGGIVISLSIILSSFWIFPEYHSGSYTIPYQQIFLWLFVSTLTISLATRSRSNDNLKIVTRHTIFESSIKLLVKLAEVFLIRSEKYPKAYHYYWLQDLNLATLSYFLFSYFSVDTNLNFTFIFLFTSLVGLSLVLLTYLTFAIRIEIKTKNNLERFWLQVGKGFGHLDSIRDRINFTKRVNIKINLGHESLKEVDVLRLISRRVAEDYKIINNFLWHFPLGLSNRLFKFFIVFLTIGLVYTKKDIYTFHTNFKKTTNFCVLFPSQNFELPLAELEKNVFNRLDSLDNSLNHIYIFNYFDLLINKIYSQILGQSIVKNYANWESRNDFQLKLLPQRPDYVFVFFIILGYFLSGLLFSYRPLGVVTHKSVLKRLNDLNDRIQAHILKETSQTVGGSKAFLRFFSNQKKSYPIADVREIETELLGIFEDIDRVPKILNRVEFVFVFDELDKIEANQNRAITDKEDEDDTLSVPSDEFSASAHQTRMRRQAVAQILANLKHFFTTARAKFIFIAGREMYDAALADTSDRNYFLGSIFHDVIYVNSFITDDEDKVEAWVKSDNNHMSYENSLIEQYVCSFLIPKSRYKGESRSLKTYRRYCFDTFNNTELNEDIEQEVKIVLGCLRKFIFYLSYRSSGSPKKITFLMEDYVRQLRKKQLRLEVEKGKAIVLGKNSNNFYLYFDFNSIYTFGLINYLTTPFLYQISKNMRKYSDKLMVSTTYILDHVFKYHNDAFSWRNIELTPEIIDINKAPVMRGLINDIVDFLSNVHLENVVSGLYDFKFNKRISNEITYLSKINEKESAAFNFTLDESQEIKKHYSRKLLQLQNQHDFKKHENQEKFIHSISFIQGNLGDLHYYDQEYDDAIIAYKDATQTLRTCQDNLKLDQLIVYLRLMLKLGLTLEKKKSYASALMVYDESCKRIRNRFMVTMGEIGLGEQILDYSFDLQDSIKDMAPTDAYFELLSLSQTSTSIRLLLQPFIAKLHIKEKEKTEGITEFDLEQFSKELDFILLLAPKKERCIIKAEYENKVGDILFFKNYESKKFNARKYYTNTLRLILEGDKDSGISELGHVKNLERLHSFLSNSPKNKKTICEMDVSFKTLGNNLSDLADTLLSEEKEDTKSNPENALSKTLLKTLLLDLDKILNSSENKKLDSFKSLKGNSKNNQHKKTILAACYYYAYASRTHCIMGDLKKAANQIIKILYVIEDNLILIDLSGVNHIEKYIVQKYLNFIYLTYNASSRPEIEKFKQLFEIDNFTKDSQFILTQIPAYTEIQEALGLFYMIKLKCKESNFNESDLFKLMGLNVGSIYSRIVMLHLKTRYNLKSILKITRENYLNTCPDQIANCDVLGQMADPPVSDQQLAESIDYYVNVNSYEVLEKVSRLVSDSIYCFSEILSLYKGIGTSRLTPFSSIAMSYQRRAWWLGLRAHIMSKKKVEDKIAKPRYIRILEEDLFNILDSSSTIKLKVKYNSDKARINYMRCLEVHDNKLAYGKIISDMFYLDDDFDDEYYHFHTALERNRVNANRISRELNYLQECAQGKRELFSSKPQIREEDFEDNVANLLKIDHYY